MTAIATDVTPNVAATLIDALIASNRGDRHAFDFGNKTYSYQDVAALMNRTGNMIKTLGVPARGRVLLLLPESPAFVATLLGAIKAGAVPVVGAPVDDAAALARSVAMIEPVAAVVHHTCLGNVANAVAGIRNDALVIVGTDTHAYKSFVDEVRGQPSWLPAEPVTGEWPALGVWNGTSLDVISHADIDAFIRGNARIDNGAITPAASRLATMLNAFSNAEKAQLR
jgi:acyl-coenzyme A synthetase/AMP-(fatty) acid ligase